MKTDLGIIKMGEAREGKRKERTDSIKVTSRDRDFCNNLVD